jgi:hypothetical protein
MGFPPSPTNGQTYTTQNGSVYIYESASVKWKLQTVSPTLIWQEAVLSIETSPPGTPTTGDRHLVGNPASGAFADHEGEIAEYNGSGWDFEAPSDQWAVFNAGTSEGYVFYGGAWHLLYDLSGWIDHEHSGDDITSGAINKARLGTGTGSQGDILEINSSGVPEWVEHDHDDEYTPLAHASQTNNPHSVSAAQVGLGNVTNNAQVKKAASSTANRLPKWNAATGDELVDSSVAEADAADAVAKKHDQNTDAATTAASFQIDYNSNGPRVKNNGGAMEVRNGADSALAIIRGATPAGNTDLTPKAYVDGKITQTINENQTGTSPSEDAVFDALAGKSPLGHTHSGVYEPANANIQSHIGATSGNPHNVAKADVGLGNVDNVQQIPLSQKAATSGVASLDSAGKLVQLPANGAILDAQIGSAAAIAQSKIANLTTDLGSKINTSEKGAANGVASLDATGKIPIGQIPDTAANGVDYKGTWDCSGGVYPTNPAKGDYYICTVAGTISSVDYQIGDWLVFNGSTWDKVDNSDKLQSVTNIGSAGVGVFKQTSGTEIQLKKINAANGLISVVDNTEENRIDLSVAVSKTDVGLGNVDNVQQLPLSQKGAASGVATLDANSLLPVTQLPGHEHSAEDIQPRAGATITRDGNGLVSQVAVTGGPTYTVTRNGSDQITQIATSANVWTFTRDGEGRISGWSVGEP